MKWNWGKGVVVGMLAFMSFIMYLVITMSTDKNYSHDLVTEEYYAKEIAYQEEIDAETNTNNLKEKITGKRTEKGWEIIFPAELDPEKIKGTVFLYRPSNKKLDFSLPLDLTSSNLLIPGNRMLDGRWNITIDWDYEKTQYLYKKQIVY
ncbi:FixH family protein [Spongiivirga citrea]|uniref:Cytochrome C oxidase Cbb3 n=1 Tax=Spongiivirga citrea TaxID=1481457 RepID=A0A6M0CNY6_9FLAO|nr:FixH family protein [Spongiivirga citrea]NER17764.1 cytochrome C oxidase Cbb3 [Spongiivirga citrea]